MSLFLLIDAGGTKTTFHQYSYENKNFILKHAQTYLNKDHPDFYSLLDKYQHSFPQKYKIIGIAAAGLIKENQVYFTNLDWEINKNILFKNHFPALSLEDIILLNDLEASAYYPPITKENKENILIIHDSYEENFFGNFCVISIGTGLGISFATYSEDSQKYSVFPGEGGHALFSPYSSKQLELYEYYKNLLDSGQVITNEFFLSGEGLIRIYEFLNSKGNVKSKTFMSNISTRQIYQDAKNSEKVALDSIELFFEILAGASMNIALTILTEGGIFFSGGMIINFIEFLDKKSFINNFQKNIKMQSLLKKIPLYIINSPETPILGLLEYFKKTGC